MVLLSSTFATQILSRLQDAGECPASLDLGLTQSVVSRSGSDVRLGQAERVSLDDLRRIERNPDVVFVIAGGQAEKLIRFSSATSRTYKLRPTADWPALEISGVLMHRIKDTTPRIDAEAKIRLLQPVRGDVLETCMGLGYTAILASSPAAAVTVIEKDETVVELASINPYSRRLFESPAIRRIIGDAAQVVTGLSDCAFDIVNHDPPTLSLAGELYADSFYGHLLRILRPGGKLLHYVGSPGGKSRGMDLNKSVGRRLRATGFTGVRGDLTSGCILAVRPPARP